MAMAIAIGSTNAVKMEKTNINPYRKRGSVITLKPIRACPVLQITMITDLYNDRFVIFPYRNLIKFPPIHYHSFSPFSLGQRLKIPTHFTKKTLDPGKLSLS